MEDTAVTLDTLRALSRLGASISVDDFGTGYSSLSYLKRFSVQRLKIDRSFVAEINEKHDTTAIVEAIISLARSLYIEVVAEGVETTDQRDFLVSRGCALLQGYLFHAALPPAKMEALLRGDDPALQPSDAVHDAPQAIVPDLAGAALLPEALAASSPAAPVASMGVVTPFRPRSVQS